MYVFLTDHGLLAVVNGWIDERNCDEDSCGCSCLVVTVLHVGFLLTVGFPSIRRMAGRTERRWGSSWMFLADRGLPTVVLS